MQVSPSGMAAASQAASGEFDSRHLLQLKNTRFFFGCFLLAIFSLRQCRRKSLDFPLPAPLFKTPDRFQMFLLANSALCKKPFPFRFFSQWIKAQKNFQPLTKPSPRGEGVAGRRRMRGVAHF